MRPALLLGLLGAASACGSFEDPVIVIDLRMLAATATPPEQVVVIDLENPPEPEDFDELGLVDVEICGLVADPGASRGLTWEMRVCAPTGDGRCPDDVDHPEYELGSGRLDDPEEAGTAQMACATLPADPALLLVLEDAVSGNDLVGFGGIDVQVAFRFAPDDLRGQEEEAAAIYGTKEVRYSPLLPPERRANINPTVTRIDIEVENADPIALPLGRCAEQDEPLRIAAGEELPLIPVEPDGVREDYLVPTLDGESRMFTETLTYQWLASDGSWNRAFTGGGRDVSGALPPLDATWRTPPRDEVTEPIDVTLWIIQRDERLGQAWFESCVRVMPNP